MFPRRSKSSARVDCLLTPSTRRRSRHFGRELKCQTEKLVKIKCVRMTEDKAQEEIEIEVPESIYVIMEDDDDCGWNGVTGGWSRRIKGYFYKSDKN